MPIISLVDHRLAVCFSCSCPMSRGRPQKCDRSSDGRVHGLLNLRLTDASIMLSAGCAHTLTAIAIGELMSQMVRERERWQRRHRATAAVKSVQYYFIQYENYAAARQSLAQQTAILTKDQIHRLPNQYRQASTRVPSTRLRAVERSICCTSRCTFSCVSSQSAQCCITA